MPVVGYCKVVGRNPAAAIVTLVPSARRSQCLSSCRIRKPRTRSSPYRPPRHIPRLCLEIPIGIIHEVELIDDIVRGVQAGHVLQPAPGLVGHGDLGHGEINVRRVAVRHRYRVGQFRAQPIIRKVCVVKLASVVVLTSACLSYVSSVASKPASVSSLLLKSLTSDTALERSFAGMPAIWARTRSFV